jgi:hypothetical protein
MSPSTQCQVSRSGQIIGIFDLTEMSSKVASGVVLPTDYYWIAGMSNWLIVSSNAEWVKHTSYGNTSSYSPPPPVARPPITPSSSKTYPSGMMVCTQCGGTATESHTKGSFLIEILLWFFFCVPGVIYSIWRLTTRGKVCSGCKSERLVPANSPAGRQMLS